MYSGGGYGTPTKPSITNAGSDLQDGARKEPGMSRFETHFPKRSTAWGKGCFGIHAAPCTYGGNHNVAEGDIMAASPWVGDHVADVFRAVMV